MSNGQFALQLSQFVSKTKANADVVVRKVTTDMLSSVVLRSPVDTGRFRGNWQVSIGAPAVGTLTTEDRSGGPTISRGSQVMLSFRVGPDVFIVNNLPYARRLEDGWSDQAPQGMVRLTVQNVQKMINDAIAKLP